MLEAVERQLVDRHRRVLPQPGKIHEPQIDELNLLFTAQLEHISGVMTSLQNQLL